MKEQLYTIPVNDIFEKNCECPICAMKKNLEEDAVAFTMGPSYMEDDIRMATDQTGFCSRHMQLLYDFENRLALALIIDTQMKNIIKNIELLQKKGRKTTGGLFSKKEKTPLFRFTDQINNSCFICERIKRIFERYLATTFYLYENDSSFVTKFKQSRGFCLEHYGLLYEMAPTFLRHDTLEAFTTDLDYVFLENYKRMEEELSWFVDKFDYRNADAPWKTSKDALPRAMTKCNGILTEE